MKNTVVINIYNFIRMSHVEPSIFIPDDFETVRNQIILIRQYGFPATYALKYDALMEPRYQELLKTYTGINDEISAWWEITEELCRKAGVAFRGAWTEEFDERVNSAYSIGYTPEERRKLVDAYMDDFFTVFGFYPKTIGSWVLDTVTISHAAEKYGILGSAICRDQIGTDGFTLWGGFPNGIYYPSRMNENIPANTHEGQLSVPMFRLLGPDPIYNFEQDVRKGLHGVYTLEPSWLIGRNPEWISWFFGCLTEEDSIGVGYAHIGQENNFLWENIKPGLEPQLKKLQQLVQEQPQKNGACLRIETMADSAAWFRYKYRITPPATFQASKDWDKTRNLSAKWYACNNYRVGFLGENCAENNSSEEISMGKNVLNENSHENNTAKGKQYLRIRDFFLYRQEYPSRYLKEPMHNTKSTFDALPLLFPQLWNNQSGQRPFIRLLDENGCEPVGSIRYQSSDSFTSRTELYESTQNHLLAVFHLCPDHILLEGNFRLCFDTLPVFQACVDNNILLEYEGFSYSFEVTEGKICRAGKDGLEITPEYGPNPESDSQNDPKITLGRILLTLGQAVSPEEIFTRLDELYGDSPHFDSIHSYNFVPKDTTIQVPPMAPIAKPESCIFPAGTAGAVTLCSSSPDGEIRYTLDGTEPTEESALYLHPITLDKDTVISARLFLPDGRCSETTVSGYRFGIPGIRLTSSTFFDPRPVFSGSGITDLLNPRRGSLDYLDGRWRGTLKDLDIWGELPESTYVDSIIAGFLSHHRSGIIFPEFLQLYTGPNREQMTLTAELTLPCEPCLREIARQDFALPVKQSITVFRLVAHRYEKMPQWCCYRGSEAVFTMVDNVIISPGEINSLA